MRRKPAERELGCNRPHNGELIRRLIEATRVKNLMTLIRQVTGEKINISENGWRRQLSKTELMIRQLVNRAAQGNLKAIQNVLRLIAEFKLPEPKNRIDAILEQLGYMIFTFREGREPEIESGPVRRSPATTPANRSVGARRRRRRRRPFCYRKALSEKITITESTRLPRVSKLEAILQQLTNEASQGDLAATRSMPVILFKIRQGRERCSSKGGCSWRGFSGLTSGGRGNGRAARIDDVKFVAEVTPEDEAVIYRIDVRRRYADHILLVAEGRVIARETERATVGGLFVCVIKESQRSVARPAVLRPERSPNYLPEHLPAA